MCSLFEIWKGIINNSKNKHFNFCITFINFTFNFLLFFKGKMGIMICKRKSRRQLTLDEEI